MIAKASTKLLCLLIPLALISCGDDEKTETPAPPKELTEEVIHSMLSDYLDHEGVIAGLGPNFSESYDLENAHITELGDRYRVVSLSINSKPPGMCVWLASRNGVEKIRSDNLLEAFYGISPAKTDEQKQAIIDRYLFFLHLESSGRGSHKVIDSLDDIEGYEKNKLEPDLESMVRAPYEPKDGTHVFYTYNRIGGELTRYRFEFDHKGYLRRVDVFVLGRKIGDYRIML